MEKIDVTDAEVGRLAQELFELWLGPDASFDWQKAGYKDRWRAVARHVLFQRTARPEDVEAVASIIFNSGGFYRADQKKPAWVMRGNSIRQDDARHIARAIIARYGAPPATLTTEREAVIKAAQDVVYHHFALEMRRALILAVEVFLASKPDPRIAAIVNELQNDNLAHHVMAARILTALDAAGRNA